MNQAEFVKKYEEDKEMYEAWGLYAQRTIEESLASQNADVSNLVKIKVVPRVKEIESLLEKAFYRNKDYQNPYEDITDKVGIRFVVLLEVDVKGICDQIIQCDQWDASHDRDYERERKERPELFDYKSMHFIVKCKKDFQFNDLLIKKGTACEIQVRTLLQHAYAEMAHDQIYKGKKYIEPEVKRVIARSMALIEATDQFFGEANAAIKRVNLVYSKVMDKLQPIYKKQIGVTKINHKLNFSIIEDLKELLIDFDFEEINIFLDEKPFVIENIKKDLDKYLHYTQPIVLLLFYFLSKKKRTLLSKWDAVPDFIKPIGVSLGIGIDN